MMTRPYGDVPTKVRAWIAWTGCLILIAPGTTTRAEDPTDPPSPIPWRSNLAGALLEARNKSLPVWIQFTGPYCPSCKKMDQTSLRDPDVVAVARDEVIAVRVPADGNEQLAYNYGLSSLPATLLIQPDGALIDRAQGYAEPQEFRSFLRRALGNLPVHLRRSKPVPAVRAETRQSVRVASTSVRPPVAVAPATAAKPPAATAAKPSTEVRVGLDGSCPVTLVRTGRLVGGSSGLTHEYQGVRYQFASQAALDTFRSSPDAFAPVEHGTCRVERVDSRRVVYGLTLQGLYYDGRLYLCSSAEARARFLAEPRKYALPSPTPSPTPAGTVADPSRLARRETSSSDAPKSTSVGR